MYDAFTTKPNYKPFNAVPNQIPLTEAIATPPACGLDTLGQTGAAAQALNKAEAAKTAVPASEKATAAAWQALAAGAGRVLTRGGWIRLDKIEPACAPDRLVAAGGLELPEDALEVALDRVDRDEQLGRDLGGVQQL